MILAHNYQAVEIQDLADYRGDSLQLAMLSRDLRSPLIVFCGVRFMAETAAILNETSRVLLPVLDAGCPMADMVSAEDVRKLREKHPGAAVVTYINSSAGVKAVSDICCTSSNAVKIVNSAESEKIIFVPDKNLGSYVARFTDKEIILHEGYCPAHNGTSKKQVEEAKNLYPGALVLAHPECPPAVVEAADFSGSTSAMIRYVQEHPARQYFLLTECAMADNIIAENPEKEVLRMCSHRCPHMAQITLEDTRAALAKMQYEVHVPENIRLRAKASIARMLAPR